MAIKILLQTSTVEIPIKTGKDASGATAGMTLGVKRYPLQEAQDKLNTLRDLLSNQVELIEQEGKDKPTVLYTPKDIDNFILNEVIYLKNAPMIDEDTGKRADIADTRKVIANSDLWGEAVNCCSFLLQLYLQSAPWRSPIILGVQQALINTDLSAEFTTKN